MNVFMKIPSGSDRDKSAATPKQNKWADPFYCAARGKGKNRTAMSRKVDSIRENLSKKSRKDEPVGLFKSIVNTIKNFFGFNSRKGLS